MTQPVARVCRRGGSARRSATGRQPARRAVEAIVRHAGSDGRRTLQPGDLRSAPAQSKTVEAYARCSQSSACTRLRTTTGGSSPCSRTCGAEPPGCQRHTIDVEPPHASSTTTTVIDPRDTSTSSRQPSGVPRIDHVPSVRNRGPAPVGRRRTTAPLPRRFRACGAGRVGSPHRPPLDTVAMRRSVRSASCPRR